MATERETEMLPCECGCKTQSWWRHMTRGHVVTCDNILCRNDAHGIDMVQARAAWNMRKSNAPQN